jgi:hypothetical protein
MKEEKLSKLIRNDFYFRTKKSTWVNCKGKLPRTLLYIEEEQT